MTWDPLSVTEDDILADLRLARVLGSAAKPKLQRFPTNVLRKDSNRRFTYRVRVGDETVFHLTVGPELSGLHAKATTFAAAVPDIACKPLFLVRKADYDLFGQEFFGEGNLKDGLAEGRIDAVEWHRAVSFVKAKLDATAEPSSHAEVSDELAEIEKAILGLDGIQEPERIFIESNAFPLIREGASKIEPRTTWTNGDFVAQNILWDRRSGYRLVDVEFAERTHFGRLDWLRLRMVSLVPPSALIPPACVPGESRWLEMLCWIQHALRLNEVVLHGIALAHLKVIVGALADLVAADLAISHPDAVKLGSANCK
jgi:hypothetical protein